MWAHEHEVEHAALNQLRGISRLPWVRGVRVMPDVHLGKGATVGSVIAMRDALSPSAVGVDIGCGVAAVRTSLTVEDLPDDLAPLRSAIEAAVPVGFSAHERDVDLRPLRLAQRGTGLWRRFGDLHPGVQDRETRAHHQLGTLGGGNHFIEVCASTSGQVWLTLHSGSRNIGKEIAERHIAAAKVLRHNVGLPDRDLAVFLAGTPEMDAYRRDLDWAQDYAALSREVMLALLEGVLRRAFPAVVFSERISIHHNYVTEEVVDGERLLVTRKGAIRAGAGTLGLIPGSMGVGSYVVRGKGDPRSYWSASHGAGRRMSRGEAKRRFTTADLAEQTRGVESRKDAGVLDEAPGAYKDLAAVIAAQEDLVEVVEHLRPLVCVKG
ncbi:RtcB family protein [Kineococcus xinjiangensis]